MKTKAPKTPKYLPIQSEKANSCWFFASLAAVTRDEKCWKRTTRVRDPFIDPHGDAANLTAVSFFNGLSFVTLSSVEWDPWKMHALPTTGGMDQLWCALVERGFKALSVGHTRPEWPLSLPDEALATLTGSFVLNLLWNVDTGFRIRNAYLTQNLKLENHSGGNLSRQLSNLLQRYSPSLGYLCCCVTKSCPGHQLSADNWKCHSYTILSVSRIEVDESIGGQKHSRTMVKLRDPLGKTWYDGPWSKSDSRWESATDDLRPKIVASRGIFFVDAETFVKNFQMLTVCDIRGHMTRGRQLSSFMCDMPLRDECGYEVYEPQICFRTKEESTSYETNPCIDAINMEPDRNAMSPFRLLIFTFDMTTDVELFGSSRFKALISRDTLMKTRHRTKSLECHTRYMSLTPSLRPGVHVIIPQILAPTGNKSRLALRVWARLKAVQLT